MKELSLLEIVSIGIGGMVGGGIFAVLGLSAQIAGKGAPISFLIAGVVALVTAYSYAKLTKKYPSRGGTVEFLIKKFGRGVFTGGLNILLLMSYIIMLSLYAYTFGSYGATFFPFPTKHVLITFVVLLFTFLNVLGSKAVGESEQVIVVTKLLILGIFVVGGLMFTKTGSVLSSEPIGNLVSGGMIIFLAYEGFELISNASEDAKSLVDVEKAFYISVVFVAVLYVLVSFVAVENLSAAQIASARDYALAEAAKPFLGKIGFVLIAVAALLSTGSAINATLYGSARMNYIIAKDGELPKFMEDKIWNKPIEGLLITSLLTLIIANFFDLSSISVLGSSGFLIIFSFVNLANFKDSESVVSLLGFLMCALSLAVFFYYELRTWQAVVEMTALVVSPFVIELAYRVLSGRELAETMRKNV